ncbi:hypothetical protein Fmac_021754 [Flemingia macrophylla]|uniref:B box-type domain-containing protein n=1 Tax=Flemingia macrophylla TaxID=520843 RepID=A0ABD1LXS7_9FABA
MCQGAEIHGGSCRILFPPKEVASLASTTYCDLCGLKASLYCRADNAYLCRKCDKWVHKANILALRHVRCFLCNTCRNLTQRYLIGVSVEIVLPLTAERLTPHHRARPPPLPPPAPPRHTVPPTLPFSLRPPQADSSDPRRLTLPSPSSPPPLLGQPLSFSLFPASLFLCKPSSRRPSAAPRQLLPLSLCLASDSKLRHCFVLSAKHGYLPRWIQQS